MKKILEKIRKKIQMAAIKTQSAVADAAANEAGDFYISDGVKVILAVVLGALLLAAMTLLFNSTIIPKITEQITEMFG